MLNNLQVRILAIKIVLHFTCFNNNLCLTQKVVEYCTKSHEISKKELANLINSKNKEGFTPMHLASFKGNLVMHSIND